MNLDSVVAVIAQQFPNRAIDVRQVRDNEVHCEIAADALAAFALFRYLERSARRNATLDVR